MGRKVSRAAVSGAAVLALALLLASGAVLWLEGALAAVDFSAIVVTAP